jgi:hypothetical protein
VNDVFIGSDTDPNSSSKSPETWSPDLLRVGVNAVAAYTWDERCNSGIGLIATVRTDQGKAAVTDGRVVRTAPAARTPDAGPSAGNRQSWPTTVLERVDRRRRRLAGLALVVRNHDT